MTQCGNAALLMGFCWKIGVEYLNPAYDCASSVEQRLYDRGIIETREVRGTQDDKQVFYAEQVLLALFLKYYLTRYSQEKYERVLKELYSNRIDLMQGWLSEFQSHKTIKGLEKWTFQV
jgi:AAA+ ATPase superfamily predicted ATPase